MNEDNFDEFRAHVEQLLCEAFGLDHLEVDEDGDWPFVKDGRSVFAQVVAEPDLHVHVFSRIATGVSVDVLPEINELNSTMTWAKLVRTEDGAVFAAQRIHCSGVSAEVLALTISAIYSYSKDCGELLQTVYGEPATRSTVKQPTTSRVITSLATGHVGEGLRGQSFAIPTMAGFGVLERGVAKFIRFAALFATTPSNVIKPAGW